MDHFYATILEKLVIVGHGQQLLHLFIVKKKKIPIAMIILNICLEPKIIMYEGFNWSFLCNNTLAIGYSGSWPTTVALTFIAVKLDMMRYDNMSETDLPCLALYSVKSFRHLNFREFIKYDFFVYKS